MKAMSLHTKALLVSITAILGLLSAQYVVTREIVLQSHSRLEEEDTRANVARALGVVANELDHFEALVTDWAAWDDTYAYLRGENEAFPTENFADTADTFGLHAILITDCAAQPIYAQGFDTVSKQAAPLPAALRTAVAANSLLDCGLDLKAPAGRFLVVDGTVWLVAAHPVVTSRFEGPAIGMLVFGRALDAAQTDRLVDLTQLPLSLVLAPVPSDLARDGIQVIVLNAATIQGRGWFSDEHGLAPVAVQVELPREYYAHSQWLLTWLLWAFVAGGIVLVAAITIPLEKLVLARLGRLSAAVQAIGARGDRQARLSEAGSDELSHLAREINQMLGWLEQSELALRRQERESILNAVPDLLFVVSRQGTIVEAHSDQPAFCGIPLAKLVGRPLSDFAFAPAALAAVQAQVEQMVVSGAPHAIEIETAGSAGAEWAVYEFRIVALNADEVLALVRDVTARKRAEGTLRDAVAALQASEQRYMLAVQGANDGLWDWDMVSNRVYYSPRWRCIIGDEDWESYAPPDAWFSRVHPDDLERVKLALANHLGGLTPHFACEHRIRHKDGSYLWVLTRGLAFRRDAEVDGDDSETDTGSPWRMAGSMTEIADRKRAEEQLLYKAFHDSLTGIANRALFLDRLYGAIERSRRRSTASAAVLFMDLDRFKVINDSLGHLAGDQLLVSVAQRLQALLRTTDSVSRLGGDEFAILLEEMEHPGDLMPVVARIRQALQQPFTLNHHEVVVTASIGIVTNLGQYDQADDLLQDADIAMYRAKTLGRNRHEVFKVALRTQAIERLELENELRKALEHDEFVLNYQPIMLLGSGQVIGFEALLRWQSPTRGRVVPDQFIPIAEETGLIIPIGEWVLRQACRQLHAWQTPPDETPRLTISVNLSGVQLTHPGMCEMIRDILLETRVDPSDLKLEITESVFLTNAQQAQAVLLRLRNMGVQLQIDDFGTGYSSLSYLHQFPVHAIKIDRSFILRISEHGQTAGHGLDIVKTIVNLAHDLGLEAVAEGVETAEQLLQLQGLGCQFGQGYLFARPLETEAAGAMLAREKSMQ